MIIVALDPPPHADPREWCSRIVSSVAGHPSLAGVKIGLPAIVSQGLGWVKGVLEAVEGLRVADLKLADIGAIMRIVIERLASAGFDAVIMHAFVGDEGALDEAVDWCRAHGVKAIAVVSMSHPGSAKFIDKHTKEMVEMCRRLGVWGFVAPATRPSMIKLVRDLAPDSRILSPGVGAQGATPGQALCAGADYEIVGRAITRAEDPRKALEEMAKLQREALQKCRVDT